MDNKITWKLDTVNDFRCVANKLNENGFGNSVTISLSGNNRTWNVWGVVNPDPNNRWFRFEGDANADVITDRLNFWGINPNNAIVCEFSKTWFVWCYVSSTYNGPGKIDPIECVA